MINFPDAPAVDDEFTDAASGATWLYDGAKWTSAAGGSAKYVLKTGDTMTGELVGTDATFSGSVVAESARLRGTDPVDGVGFALHSPINAPRIIVGYADALPRWGLLLGDNAPESTGNAGADFELVCYDDAGAGMGPALTIDRATKSATFSAAVTAQSLVVNESATVNQNLQVNGASNTHGLTSLSTSSGGTPQIGLCDLDGASMRGTWYWTAATGLVMQAGAGLTAYISIDQGGNFNWLGGTGVAIKAVDTLWTVSSDARIKTVSGDYTGGLAEIIQLQPKSFTYKGNDTPTEDVNTPMGAGPDKAAPKAASAPYPASPNYMVAEEGKTHVGLIAQEVEQIFPGTVHTKAGFIDGAAVDDMRMFNPSEILFALINAVKELSAKVTALEGGAPAREVTVNTVNVQPTRASPPRNGRKR